MARIRQETTAMMGLFLLLACLTLFTDAFTLLPSPSQQRATGFVVPHHKPCNLPFTRSPSDFCLQSSSTDQETVSGVAESIFQKNCDKDGLMTQTSLKKLAFITEMLADEDLTEDELDQMWKSAPKFPGSSDDERIDVDSFVKIYRDIDDLFEEEDDDVDPDAAALAEIEAASSVDEKEDKPEEDAELATIFKTIADSQGLLTKDALSQWEEVQSLTKENLLGEDEFNSIWKKMPKTDGLLDLVGFLKFNAALDDLFDFEDLDDDDKEEEVQEETPEVAAAAAPKTESKGMVTDDDLSPAALYEALADSDGLVGIPELQRWGELQEMVTEGEITGTEIENFFGEIVKAGDKLDRDGFLALYDKIDSLFEDDDDDDEEPQAGSSGTKEQLLATVTSLNQDEDRLPCGLECTESEQRYVQELVQTLEAEATNEVRIKQGAIEMTDLAGDWELLYSSSAAMAYNKGLSGLGGSVPNGSFAGLKMKLINSKFLTDVEYTERIKVVPDTASFDVLINGSWELRSSVSIFTGEPSIVLTIVPNMVTYGPTSTRADHWKSLGPVNMLDLSYLDKDLRIMRGNTMTDSILIFKRTN